MDKREYLMRLLLFFILAAGIMFVFQRYGNKLLPPAPPAAQRPSVTLHGNGMMDAHTSQSLAATPALAAAGQTSATLAPGAAATPPAAMASVSRGTAPRVALKTKVFDIEFSRRGGVPVRWDVIDPRFAQPPLDAKGNPVKGAARRDPLILQGLAGMDEVALPLEVILFEANARYYKEFNESLYQAEGPALDGKPGWRFTSEVNPAGVRLVKTYRFSPESYVCKLTLKLENTGHNNINFDKDETGLGLQMGPGVGQDLPDTNPMSHYAKVDVTLKSGETLVSHEMKKPGDQELFPFGVYDWGAVQGLYFSSVLVPGAGYPMVAAKTYLDTDLLMAARGPAAPLVTDRNAHFYPSLEMYGKPFRLAAGETKTFDYELFMGPNQSQVLNSADHDLRRLLFHDSYWWMRGLALGLMVMLRWFHAMVSNWGVAIILLTVTVRLLIFPLVQKGMKTQAKAMAEQMRLKPLMDRINERYKDDPVRRQQEIMKLYKEHGVNPLGAMKGCFWLLIQAPIFFALYKLLSHSIELRGATFLWMTDLSQADRLYTLAFGLPVLGNHINLLPFLVAITQMLSSKFMQQPASDPKQAEMQKMMMYIMPFFMLFITYGLPAGLMLYWLVSSLWQIIQQLWVNKHIPRPGMPAAAKAGAAGVSNAVKVRK